MADLVVNETEREVTEAKERRTYLLEVYKLYHGHINTMFNFFLIVSGLIGNACILSLQRQAAINRLIPAAIGILGALTSLVLLLVHIRSREMIDVIERSLEKEEKLLFEVNGGFFLADQHPKRWFLRHRYQFRIIYVGFIGMFLLLAGYAAYLHHTGPNSPYTY
jgi:DMSO reductase anchor subunit